MKEETIDKILYFIEKWCPTIFTLIGLMMIVVLVYWIKSDFIISLCRSMLTNDSLSLLITIESILFGCLLTFLGLFVQMDEKRLGLIRSNINGYKRLIYSIIAPLCVSLGVILTTYVLYLIDEVLNDAVYLLWGVELLYSFFLSFRLIYAYFLFAFSPELRELAKKKKEKKENNETLVFDLTKS